MDRCSVCGNQMSGQGAVVFSPPQNGTVHKYHVCPSCWTVLDKLFSGRITAKQDKAESVQPAREGD